MVLLTHIYSKGYYVEYDLDAASYLLLKFIPAKYISGKHKLQDIIKELIQLDLFDKDLFKEEVFTSKEIQEIFKLATKKRKQQEASPYWLLDQEEIIDDNKKVEAKEEKKKTKREIRKVRQMEDIEDKAPKRHHLTNALIEAGYIDRHDLETYKYDELFEEAIAKQDYAMIQKITKYIIDYEKQAKGDKTVLDKFSFFKKSMFENIERLTYQPKESISEMIEKLAKEQAFKNAS
jgi:6-phosphofructokinase